MKRLLRPKTDDNDAAKLELSDTEKSKRIASKGARTTAEDLVFRSFGRSPKGPVGLSGLFAHRWENLARALRDAGEKVVDEEGNAFESDEPAPLALGSIDENAVRNDRKRRARYAAVARGTYAMRRQRGRHFGNPDLFGEPGWDILLDLYIADFDERPISVSSASIGSASPSTTGLRWLSVLVSEGLIERFNDPDDRRRVLVRLTKAGLDAMDAHFALCEEHFEDLRCDN